MDRSYSQIGSPFSHNKSILTCPSLWVFWVFFFQFSVKAVTIIAFSKLQRRLSIWKMAHFSTPSGTHFFAIWLCSSRDRVCFPTLNLTWVFVLHQPIEWCGRDIAPVPSLEPYRLSFFLLNFCLTTQVSVSSSPRGGETTRTSQGILDQLCSGHLSSKNKCLR